MRCSFVNNISTSTPEFEESLFYIVYVGSGRVFFYCYFSCENQAFCSCEDLSGLLNA
jgi:hypothetical protein